ncbi:hypothetical protein FH972_025857 [Carpinus fangiana]|uniref:Uncharacterized protein n=1 Tax=Carpinus fangiana TaxID=176857 RepID=A0A5N6L2L8_9ROSI|nr:hypothetical protein FH972_025857 [Carpinus fangiana]
MDRYVEIAEAAYDKINQAFEDAEVNAKSISTTKCLEIEILHPSFTLPGQDASVQRDGHCVAIPKKLLALAFLHARQNFLDQYSVDHEDRKQRKSLFSLSRMMLMYDPEVYTATNFRKVAASIKDQDFVDEINIIGAFLTSPLPRHTKSPNLWSYRFWFFTRHANIYDQIVRYCNECLNPLHQSHASQLTIRTQVWHMFVKSELAVVHMAGEKHPKNYYAFDYARKLLCYSIANIRQFPQDAVKEHDAIISYVNEIATIHHDWCLQHPSDCSGWSYLTYLLETTFPYLTTTSVIISRTIERICTLAWTGDSMWMFIKSAIANTTLLNLDARHDTLQQILLLASNNAESNSLGSSKKAIAVAAREAIDWIKVQWQSGSWPDDDILIINELDRTRP